MSEYIYENKILVEYLQKLFKPSGRISAKQKQENLLVLRNVFDLINIEKLFSLQTNFYNSDLKNFIDPLFKTVNLSGTKFQCNPDVIKSIFVDHITITNNKKTQTNDFKSHFFIEDKRLLLTGLTNGNVQIWDINTSKCIQTLKGETHRSINCLYHNKDANELYCGLDNGHISVWDLTNYKCIITSIKGHMYGVDFITYHNNTNTI
eukprot:UN28504